MSEISGPWFRRGRGGYVTIDGKQRPSRLALVSDKAAAYAAYLALRDYVGAFDSPLPAVAMPPITVASAVLAISEREGTFAAVTTSEHRRYGGLLAANRGGVDSKDVAPKVLRQWSDGHAA